METALRTSLEAVNTKIKDTRKAAEASVQAVTAAYATMATSVDKSAQEQTTAIDRRYKAELALIEQSAGSSDARYMAETAALITTTEEQLGVLRSAAAEKLSLIEQEAADRRATIAVMYESDRERAQALAALDQETMEKRRSVLGQMLSDYRQHIDTLNNEAKRHLEAVKAVEEQKRELTMNGEEKIRELQRKTMDDYAAYQDRIREIDEWTSKARQALAAGDSAVAIEYAKKAEQAANSVSSAVEKDGKTLVSQQQAVSTAVGIVNTAIGIQQRALDARGQAHQAAANAATAEAQSVEQSMQGMASAAEALAQTINAGAQFIITTNVEQLRTDVASLDALITERERMMTIQTNLDEIKGQLADTKAAVDVLDDVPMELRTNLDQVQGQADALQHDLAQPTNSQHTVGGLEAAKSDAQTLQRTLNTNTNSQHHVSDNAEQVQAEINALKRNTSSTHTIYVRKVQKNALGGLIEKFAAGGQAFRRAIGRISGPGTGTSDSIPSMLSDGEFVIRASMVKKWGAAFFESLNAGFLPPLPKYALGGAVNMPMQTAGQSEALTVTFRAGELEAPVRISDQASRESMKAFARELQRVKLVQG